jgi:NADH:ubiquinone oxidoreductase subunit E
LDEVRRDLSGLLVAFPREQRWLLPALQRVQAELGSLPLWALEEVGQHLRVPKSELYGVTTHYPELRLRRPGEHLVRVCTGLSCRVVGAGGVLGALEASLGVGAGQTTADGGVTLEEIHCAFLCSVAPVVELDGTAHGGLGAEQVVGMARDLLAPGVAR